MTYNPPKKENTCDKCGDPLVLRKDDSPEVVRARLHTYHEQTEPVKGYYEKQGKLKMVVGCELVGDTTRAVAEALGI